MTIKEIAQMCGVSISTVSRVINNRPDVSPEVRKLVMGVVREQNYVPNNSARELVRGRSDIIGVVVRGVSNPFYSGIIKAIEKRIAGMGYTMLIQQIDEYDDEIKCGAIMEREKKLRGIIFLGGRSDYSSSELALINVPFVCCSYTNSYGTLADVEYSSVSIEDEEAAYAAVSWLIRLGHRRIAALVSDTKDRSISELRYLGYLRALREHDIMPDKNLVACAGSYELERAYDATAQLVDRGADFTAIFAISDAMAIAAIKALDDAGRSVPESCSIIAIDGLKVSEYIRPTLTTLCQPVKKMGEQSLDILINMIEGHGRNQHVTLDASLRPGCSVQEIKLTVR